MSVAIQRFKKWFEGFEGNYIIIGGTACDLLLEESELSFRSTKDIDMVIIAEMLNEEFGKRIWSFVENGGYEHIRGRSGEAEFYRFCKPADSTYPPMIELFSKQPFSGYQSFKSRIIPLHIGDDLRSLSAILLDDDYYSFMKSCVKMIDSLPV